MCLLASRLLPFSFQWYISLFNYNVSWCFNVLWQTHCKPAVIFTKWCELKAFYSILMLVSDSLNDLEKINIIIIWNGNKLSANLVGYSEIRLLLLFWIKSTNIFKEKALYIEKVLLNALESSFVC